jgi:hypothetical protein
MTNSESHRYHYPVCHTLVATSPLLAQSLDKGLHAEIAAFIRKLAKQKLRIVCEIKREGKPDKPTAGDGK